MKREQLIGCNGSLDGLPHGVGTAMIHTPPVMPRMELLLKDVADRGIRLGPSLRWTAQMYAIAKMGLHENCVPSPAEASEEDNCDRSQDHRHYRSPNDSQSFKASMVYFPEAFQWSVSFPVSFW